MDWYYYIALVAIISQLLFLFQTFKNYRYVLGKYKKKRFWSQLHVALIIPCKGLDSNFEKNITSFFELDYENYLLWFVVAEESDSAYAKLCELKEQLTQSSKAMDVQIFVAGQSQSCSQKIHNLLYCYHRIGDDIKILAFADSDVCARSDWLKHLIWPLRKFKYGAASGYRWYIPKKNNLASLALSAMNAKIAQLLGNSRFNQAWGGSMAILVDTFRKVGLDKIWPKVLSDDLSLTHAVKKAGMKLAFVPACLVPSYESTTWPKLFEFGRRQFLITRVTKPWTWRIALCGSLYSVLGLWAAAPLAVYAALINANNLAAFVAVPVVFFLSQMARAILRQKMIAKLFPQNRREMRLARAADIFFSWAWSLLMLFIILSSAFGKTICWRGIRYKLLSPTQTIVKGPKKESK